MDKRQQKTQKVIFDAFSALLAKKSYDRITVQEIIDLANVGRSTFYAHFETKDELVNSMCNRIFGHIFSKVLDAEKGHDFSKNSNTLSDKLTHLLYHLKEQKTDVERLLSAQSSDIFLHYFKKYLTQLFSECELTESSNVPKDFSENHYVSSFAEAVKWWVKEDMQTSPEKLIEYYFSLTK